MLIVTDVLVLQTGLVQTVPAVLLLMLLVTTLGHRKVLVMGVLAPTAMHSEVLGVTRVRAVTVKMALRKVLIPTVTAVLVNLELVGTVQHATIAQ